MSDFPIGGPRQAVYDALSQRQFAMSTFSDKTWRRLDGVRVNIYGAGSQLQVTKNNQILFDGPMGKSLEYLDQMSQEPCK